MRTGLVILFGLTAFLAAVLLFSAEPMIGKMVLPLFGGTPAVWNTCLVYFQVIVLAGYALSGHLPPTSREGQLVERQLVSAPVLIFFTAMLVLGDFVQPLVIQPLTGRLARAAISHPTFPLIDALARSATLPLWMAATASPLLQRWFAVTGHPRAHDPYFLYAASNAGSLLALLAYPFVIEPTLSLEAQAGSWRAGYTVLAILLVSCGLLARASSRSRRANESGTADDDPDRSVGTSLPPGTRNAWLVLALVPSSWLMGVTTYLTTDLAPMPLLWVIPLALYLLSFVVAFAGPDADLVRLAARCRWCW
jgi:hypothetical protein